MTLRRISAGLLVLFAAAALPSCTISRIEDPSSTSSTAREKLDYALFDYEDLSQYVTLGQYKGVEYVYDDLTVTPDEITERQEYYMYNGGFSEYYPVSDRAAKLEDKVKLDYVCNVDGEEYRSAEDTEVSLGNSGFLEGFDDNVVGMTIGETKTFTLKFPDDYDETLAGKDAEFSVTLDLIEEIVFDELTDEVAQTLMDDTSATVQSFLDSLEKEIHDEKHAAAEFNKRSDVWAAAYKNATVTELPEREYQSCYDDAMASYEYQMYEKYQMTISEFCKEYAVEEAYYTNLATANARQFTSEELVAFAIARAEGITVTEDEVNEYTQANYEYNGYTSAEEFIGTNEFYIRCMTMQEKVVDFLVANAVEASTAE